MNTELKKAIISWIFENQNEFQILRACIQDFREYIFNSKGEYLIGGEQVTDFIKDAIKLIINK